MDPIETLDPILAIDNYHRVRMNTAWADLDRSAKEAALAKAQVYLLAHYPHVPSPLDLTSSQLVIVDTALAELSLGMAVNPPATIGGPAIKKSKVTSSTGAGEETEYEIGTNLDPYPLVTALLAGVQAVGVTAGKAVYFSRMRP